MYFTSNDGFQNIFFYQPILHTLEIKKGTDYVLSGYQREYIILNLSHYILLSYIA